MKTLHIFIQMNTCQHCIWKKLKMHRKTLYIWIQILSGHGNFAFTIKPKKNMRKPLIPACPWPCGGARGDRLAGPVLQPHWGGHRRHPWVSRIWNFTVHTSWSFGSLKDHHKMIKKLISFQRAKATLLVESTIIPTKQ